MSHLNAEKTIVELRMPTANDGAAVYNLVGDCPPLDPNSAYCNLLQCSHFAETSVAAVKGDELLGFVSGYLVPRRPDTLFVWQMAVAKQARGQGLALSMILNILSRPQCLRVSYLETTITESNKASWRLFERLTDKLNSSITSSEMFYRRQHFQDAHDTEILVRIGPFSKHES